MLKLIMTFLIYVDKLNGLIPKFVDSLAHVLFDFLLILIVITGFIHNCESYSSILIFSNDWPFFNFFIAESSLNSLTFEDNSCWVAIIELYSTKDSRTTPVSFPQFISKVS